MKRYIKNIEKIEDMVASTIMTVHAHELEIVDAALDQIFRGFDDFRSRKSKPTNRLESARLFLVTRSFNSLRVARQTLERGYYQQALTLVRMAMEDQLIAEDAESHPSTLDALLDGKGKLGRGDLALGQMAKRWSPDAKVVWDQNYGILSERAAHPRLESMKGLTAVGPDGQVTLRPGCHYDEVEVKIVLFYLLRELVLVMTTIAVVTDQVEIDWVTGAMPAFKEVDSLWKQIDKWAGEQLGVPVSD